MKKSLMILASVALGASMAVGQDVESKNVVGFITTNNLPVNLYSPIGWQFAIVGGVTNIPVASITNYANPTPGAGFSSADGIRRFNTASSTWTDYYRIASGWAKSGPPVLTTDVIHPGDLIMFVKRNTASMLTQAGEVIANDVSIPVPVNLYVAMCNPYPEEIAVNSITNYLNSVAGAGFSSADGIRRFNTASSTWTDYYRIAGGWAKSGPPIVTTDKIRPGEGFMFVKRTTPSVITFNSPLN